MGKVCTTLAVAHSDLLGAASSPLPWHTPQHSEIDDGLRLRLRIRLRHFFESLVSGLAQNLV